MSILHKAAAILRYTARKSFRLMSLCLVHLSALMITISASGQPKKIVNKNLYTIKTDDTVPKFKMVNIAAKTQQPLVTTSDQTQKTIDRSLVYSHFQQPDT